MWTGRLFRRLDDFDSAGKDDDDDDDDDDCVLAVHRVIILHSIPRSICFGNQHGDILLGIGEHLHGVDHKNCKFSPLSAAAL